MTDTKEISFCDVFQDFDLKLIPEIVKSRSILIFAIIVNFFFVIT